MLAYLGELVHELTGTVVDERKIEDKVVYQITKVVLFTFLKVWASRPYTRVKILVQVHSWTHLARGGDVVTSSETGHVPTYDVFMLLGEVVVTNEITIIFKWRNRPAGLTDTKSWGIPLPKMATTLEATTTDVQLRKLNSTFYVKHTHLYSYNIFLIPAWSSHGMHSSNLCHCFIWRLDDKDVVLLDSMIDKNWFLRSSLRCPQSGSLLSSVYI